MLNIKRCKELLIKEEYDKIYNLLEKEYLDAFYKLLKRDKKENPTTLLKLLLEVNSKYPSYEGTFKILTEAFFNEKMTKGEKISFLFDAYPEVINILKENKKKNC